MASVTKSRGGYFHEKDRVWNEARQSGVGPSWIGNWSWRFPLEKPIRSELKEMFSGEKYLKRVQANRVGCFDLTVTYSKSVSLLAYGLTPPEKWRGWTRTFARISNPEVARLLKDQRINSGAKGALKLRSEGVAVPFHHWLSNLGKVHAHTHYAIPNLSASADARSPKKQPTFGSIANARKLYEQQGVLRARIQKGLDDVLQARGIETVRIGKMVELAGVPKALLEELSPARRAMNEARAAKVAAKAKGGDAAEKAQGARKFDGPKAQDFFARQARRDGGPKVDKTPWQVHRECKELAAGYGVTLESLQGNRGRPVAAHDPVTAKDTALRVAKQAIAKCAKKHGEFTAEQFQEKLFTLAIGKPTTLKALDEVARDALKERSIAGVRARKASDGSKRYSAPESEKVKEEAKAAYRDDTKGAWDELKASLKKLGASVIISSARQASEIAKRLGELFNPAPEEVRIDGRNVASFIERHSKSPYWRAHGRALLSAVFVAHGNPHERLGYAEKRFAELRSYKRLSNNTVYIVERGDLTSPRQRQQLAKIARRDGATLFISEMEKARENSQQKTRHRSL